MIPNIEKTELDSLFDEFILIKKDLPPIARNTSQKNLLEHFQDVYPPEKEEKKAAPKFNALPLVKAPKTFEDEIVQFFYLFLKDYWEPTLQTQSTTSPYILSKHLFLVSVRVALPIFVRQTFFKEPCNASEIQKSVCLNQLRGVKDFLFDLSASYEQMRTKGFDPNKCTIEFEEKQHLDFFTIQMANKGKKLVIPTDLNTVDQRKNEQQLIESFILKFMEAYPDRIPAEAKEMIKELVDPFLELMNQILSPYAVALIIERLLSPDVDLVMPKDPKKRLREYDASDKAFSKDVGQLIYQITEKAVGLGAPGGVCGKAIKLFLKYMNGKKEEFGTKTQQSLNRITNSTCMIMPFRILRVMWKESKEGIKPAFVGCFDVSEEAKAELQKRVEILIQNRLLTKIQKEVEPYIPAPAKLIVNNIGNLAGSVKDFCNNLSARMFRLSQQPRLLRVLLYHYILEGMIAKQVKK